MKQLEIEFKTLLSEQDYLRLCAYYQLTADDFYTQTNVYFDTPTNDLRHKKCGLRIRQYTTKGEITLKTPQAVGLLETTDRLTLEETMDSLAKKQLPEGAVTKELRQLGIDPNQLQVLTSLTTKRAEFAIPEGLLALDESWYNQQHDYELELEVNDAHLGKVAFDAYLTTHQLPYKFAENKIVRATK
ncbi:CYTH domain-containing protein [Candidatus Enterococcus willemsii]|uniref:Adenylate cyclase n=1 Tax=Candidatus Enterococcus willemsii TaxID=1857215 RepID=A0ABQ6YWM4_9ENTE|nr:CYTH domain-containing protein [Enterococcus sp. CU12B]KAF1302101.1 adenylate cyclase [Enterococcus sp. CU12B]